MSMEETLCDLNKLINYYQKLISSISLNDCSTQQRNKSSASSMADSSSSSSLNASNASELFENLKPKKLSLNLSDVFCSNNNTNNTSLLTPILCESNSSQHSSAIGTPMTSTLTTPVNEQLFSGIFLTKKSFEDSRTKKQFGKKKQNKNVGIYELIINK